MISYREKQLLMVMKMLQDDSAQLATQTQDAIQSANKKEELKRIECNEDVASYEELIELAEDRGYDTNVRATDLLSSEELQDIERRKDEIEQKFKEITKLHKVDYVFLLVAIALQITRQVLQPRLDFESLDVEKREGDKAAAQNTDKTETANRISEERENAERQGVEAGKSKQYYYASLSEIADLKHVPYDAIIPGLSGKTHRFKTLGHDPWLGYLFGTCNILTNTLTTSDMKTVHIKNNQKYANADTLKMLGYCKERFNEKGGKPVVAIALAKQAYHIHSDQKSKAGIGLPFLQLICDEKTIRALCNRGIDFNAVEFLGTVAKQAAFAELINFVVATTHRILVAKEEYDAFCKENNISDEITLKKALEKKGISNILFGNETLNEVRTRKILLISNAVASSANIIYVGVAAGVSGAAGNSAGAYDALSKLDVGGILVTLRHLFSDGRVMAKIKDDFIKEAYNKEFAERLEAIEKECTG